MKKTYLAVIAIGVAVILAWFGLSLNKSGQSSSQTVGQKATFKSTVPQNPSATVRITDEGFSPEEVTVKVGQAVTFVNETDREAWPASDLHPTHEIYPEFDPREPIPTGLNWSFTFEKKGEWRFHDHLRFTERGVVKVE